MQRGLREGWRRDRYSGNHSCVIIAQADSGGKQVTMGTALLCAGTAAMRGGSPVSSGGNPGGDAAQFYLSGLRMPRAEHWLPEILLSATLIKNRQSNHMLKQQNLMRSKAFRYNQWPFA